MKAHPFLTLGAMLVLLTAPPLGSAWQARAQAQACQDDAKPAEKPAKPVQPRAELIQALRDYPQTYTRQHLAHNWEGSDKWQARTAIELAKKHALPEDSAAGELDSAADWLIATDDAPLLDRACARFAKLQVHDAEKLALKVRDQALTAGDPTGHAAQAALELAAWSAVAICEEKPAIERLRAAADLISRQSQPLRWARIQHAIARELMELDRWTEAEALLRPAVDEYERARAIEPMDLLGGWDDLARLLQTQGDFAEVELLCRLALRLYEKASQPEDPYSYHIRDTLADSLDSQGRFAEAEEQYRAAVIVDLANYGPEHRETLGTRRALAFELQKHGKYEEAAQEFRATVEIAQRVFGPADADTISTRNYLAIALNCRGEYAEAEHEFREIYGLFAQTLRWNDPDNFIICYHLAIALKGQEKLAEALSFATYAKEMELKFLGSKHSAVKESRQLCEQIEGKMTKEGGR